MILERKKFASEIWKKNTLNMVNVWGKYKKDFFFLLFPNFFVKIIECLKQKQ